MSTSSTPWSDRYQLGTEPIPVDRVTQPEYFELEREKVFRRVWLNVGREEDIPKPGNYFVKDMVLLRTSLIVVRGSDGVVRAFHNVCRHRGNRVVLGCSGSAKGFACDFHGWAYDLEGKLVHVPDENQFAGLCKAEHGLVPVATDVWKGFIFVNVDPQPKESLAEYLGETGRDLADFPFDSMQRMVTYVVDLKANWKVFLDAFSEGYHVPFVHKTSLPEGFRGKDVSAFMHLPALGIHKRHRWFSAPGNPALQATPAEAEVLKHDKRYTLGTAVPEELQPKGLNRDRVAIWSFDAHILFPNFFFGMSAGWCWTYNYWPLAVDRTICEARWYVERPKTAADRVAREFAKCLYRDAIREDMARLERTQQMLESGVLKEMLLSDQEVMLRHNYRVVEDYVRS
jgi:phenylpropionate dioxygenase-like ring-hydroxylating dioxygenase large terminal subunit